MRAAAEEQIHSVKMRLSDTQQELQTCLKLNATLKEELQLKQSGSLSVESETINKLKEELKDAEQKVLVVVDIVLNNLSVLLFRLK